MPSARQLNFQAIVLRISLLRQLSLTIMTDRSKRVSNIAQIMALAFLIYQQWIGRNDLGNSTKI
jgi:hypothetical protein